MAVVTTAHGRHRHLDGQHASLAAGRRLPDHYLVAAMQDPGVVPLDGPGLARRVVPVPGDPARLPVAAARNRAASAAIGLGADVVVLLDVDCLAGPDLVAAYVAAVERDPGVVWSGPVTYLPPPPPHGYPLDRLGELDDPHPARPDPGPGRLVPNPDPDLFWSLSFAMAAPAWAASGGFCEEYAGYGAEDTDFAHEAVRRGLRHGWVGDARAYHQWHAVSSPPVEHLDDILRNAAIFHDRWGRWPMQGWLRAFEERGLATEQDGRWVRSVSPARGRG